MCIPSLMLLTTFLTIQASSRRSQITLVQSTKSIELQFFGQDLLPCSPVATIVVPSGILWRKRVGSSSSYIYIQRLGDEHCTSLYFGLFESTQYFISFCKPVLLYNDLQAWTTCHLD